MGWFNTWPLSHKADQEGENLEEKNHQALAEITGWEATQIKAVTQYLPESTPLIEQIERLRQLFDLNKKTGADMSFYSKVLSLAAKGGATWDAHLKTAAAMLHITKAKFDDDAWHDVEEKIESDLGEKIRDALTTYALWRLKQEDASIKTLRDLSEYLLIDVEVSGCASISPIKQAILSLQTYLQRCRMNLEEGNIQVNIPDVWWQWIMSYRVWEANRRFFIS